MKNLYTLVTFFIFSIAFGQNPADIDPTFNQVNIPYNSYYYESNAKQVKQYSDGKLLILDANHKFTRINGNLFDNTFLTGTGFNSIVYDFEIQSDGKVIVVGDFTTYNGQNVDCIVRLNIDGSLDSSFNQGGIGYSGSEIYRVKLQANDKIILLKFGSANYNGNAVGSVFRLNSNGSYDSSFVNFTTSGSTSTSDIQMLSNDKIILVCTEGSNTLTRLLLLNVNGGQDLSFADVILKQQADYGYLHDAKLYGSDKIIIAGSFSTVNGVSKNGVVKLNLNGTIDNSFVANTGNVKRIHIQADTKIVLFGLFNTYNTISKKGAVRINSDGSIDSSFNVGTGFTGLSNSFFVFSNSNKIIVIGDFNIYKDVSVDGYMSINPDGSIDTTLKNRIKGINGGNNRNCKLVTQNDGKILVYGYFTAYNGITSHKLFRLLPNGDFDPTLNYGGTSGFYNVNNLGSVPSKVVVGGDNKIYVSGSDATLNYNNVQINQIIKLNNDGSKDTSFSTGTGFTYDNNPANKALVKNIAVQNDNKLLVYGDFSYYGGVSVNPNYFVRLNANGSRDTTFSNNLFSTVLNNEAVVSFILLNDSKILILSDLNSIFRLRRFNSDGTLDNTFNVIQVNTVANYLYEPRLIKISLDGSIFISSIVNNNWTLRKYSPAGLIDNSFVAQQGIDFLDLDFQIDNKLILAIPVNNGALLKRLNANGSIDNTFDASAFEGIVGFSPFNNVQIDVQNNGTILLAGRFDKYKGIKGNAIIRILGEDFNIFQGSSVVDYNLNGCDTNDHSYDTLKFNVNSSASNFSYYSNSSGVHEFALNDGASTITPILENPNYFTISPSVVNVDFPTQTSPLTQNFCITPVGIHPDLEVVLLPLNVARPGFDANYKLVYKNKGNQVLSGSVSLNYNDSVLDFVSALPVPSTSVTGILTWNYTNLAPFETKEITLKLNLNSPVETPPLNGGSVLNYTTTITSAQTDDTPNDNTFILNQTVVNSYDPNDKTCLQGTTVGIDKVGEYVHYVIRFENTGTYAAQNITVKDVIDTDKFDINTLMPLNGSHLFTTKISEGNKVEFYFENINLPFTDATNDGYLAFKIKTKSTLVAGDTFGGLANIYFDYNYPVITNTYTTTIQALSVKDFSFENYFSLYPNPVSDILNIDKKDNIEISSIHIYNVMGQLMMIVPNAKNVSTLDVSNLSSGNYFVKINSDRGASNTKFIKR